MKKQYIILIITMIALCTSIKAQEVEKKLDEAKTAYKSGNLEDARLSLQQALNEIDIIIGKEILALLPAKMEDLTIVSANDQVSGASAGFGGLFVNREYGNSADQKTASVVIITDSPLLSGINAILAMPGIMTASDPNQKRIKVNGYKALMQKSQSEDGTVSYDVQVPFGNSLLTFSCKGFSNETDVIAMSNTIPVSKIVEKTK